MHRLWLVPRRVLEGHDPYGWTNLVRYPEGVSQYLETLVPLAGLLASPALFLGGPILAYNVAVLVTLALSGLSAYLLVRDRTASHAAAFVGGVVYAFSPYLMAHLRAGHLHQPAAFWAPLFVLCLLRALERRATGLRWAVAAGVCLAATFYTDFQWTLSLGLLASVLVVSRLLRNAVVDRFRLVAHAVLVGVTALVLTAPLALGVWRESRSAAAQPTARAAVRHSAALLSFVAPQPAHPLWAHLVGPHPALSQEQSDEYSDEQVVALGYVALTLAAAGLLSRRTRRPAWGVALAAFGALALGQELRLHVGSATVPMPAGLPLPYELLQQLPFVGLGRAPARFAAPMTMCLAILAGQGVVALATRWPRRARWIAPACLALLVFELLPIPAQLDQAEMPTIYKRLGGVPCHGALFELPTDARSEREMQRLYYQLAHRCPISGGYLARNQPTTAIQDAWERYAREPTAEGADRMRAELVQAGFARIVFWRDGYGDDSETDERALRLLGRGDPWYAARDGMVFTLR